MAEFRDCSFLSRFLPTGRHGDPVCYASNPL
jgi:hypothetical protein